MEKEAVVRMKNDVVVLDAEQLSTTKSFFSSSTTTLFFSLITTGLFFSSITTCIAQDWKEIKGDHFLVYYMNNEPHAKNVAHRAEGYYRRVADDIGYGRHSNFWQWDKRAKIYIHPTKEAFQKITGQPTWSDGMASYFNKEIHTIEGTEDFLEGVLPHEITHLIFRDFVGMSRHVPLWMDEGVAQWEETQKRQAAKEMVRELARTGDVYTVERLTRTDIRQETDPTRVTVFYVQAISLVDFLIGKYGTASFTEFCRNLRDGKKFEEAISAAYGQSFKTLEEMDIQWRKYLKES